MRSKRTRQRIITTALGLAAAAAGVGVLAWAHTPRPPEYLCWDAPITGQPAKYAVTFDQQPVIETPRDCLRVPEVLKDGQHTVVVRAIDSSDRSSPPASLTFVVP
jgi:hypothetical protein